jgi:hypothetical protein
MTILIIVILIIIIILFSASKNRKKRKDSVSFQVEVKSHKQKEERNSKWEIVHRKTKRWEELGFGDDDLFPGYGRLYERKFKAWYYDIGTKDEKNIQYINDRYPLNYEPKDYEKITGQNVYLEYLSNTKGYDALYTGLDNKNRKRWYFALVSKKPLWIETERAIETEVEKEIPEVEIPTGYEFVQNHSERWVELGFEGKWGDGTFPGYGVLYDVTLDVWYINVGEKEKQFQSEIKEIIAQGYNEKFNHFDRVLKHFEDFKGYATKDVNPLVKKMDYKYLYNCVHKKKRWYFGIKEIQPLKIITDSAYEVKVKFVNETIKES